MAFVQVQCPDCRSIDVVQYGKQANSQRYPETVMKRSG
jgi:ribosomal protein S27E